MSADHPFVESLTLLLGELPPKGEARRATLGLRRELRKFMAVMHGKDSDSMARAAAWLEDPGRPLFNEVGRLARTFTDQMKIIRSDIPERLGSLAEHDMNDASRRLEHIVDLTESAANQTMDLAEKMSRELARRGKLLQVGMKRIDAHLPGKDLNAETAGTFRYLREAMQSQLDSDAQLQAMLTDVLVAQSYQDLTGQIIHKIINLLATLESELFKLVESFGKAHLVQETDAAKLKGPQHKTQIERRSQNDVDDLLESLGF